MSDISLYDLNELGQVSHENKSTYPADALHAAYRNGYTQALSDAKAAVGELLIGDCINQLPNETSKISARAFDCAISKAIAAIRALEEK